MYWIVISVRRSENWFLGGLGIRLSVKGMRSFWRRSGVGGISCLVVVLGLEVGGVLGGSEGWVGLKVGF